MNIKNELFRKAYEGSYYTIIGCGGDLKEWKEGYNKMLKEQGIGEPKEWHHFTGKEYNEEFETTGNNRYPDDLNFLCFPLGGMDVGKLAMFKLAMQDRWFDDIVDNDLRREGR